MDNLRLKMRDLSGCFSVAFEDVPDVPLFSATCTDNGGDTVFDHGNARWRFRDGDLIGYIVYGDKPTANGFPEIIGMWGGNY